MKIISYYVDKQGLLFQIVRTENNVEIRRVIDKHNNKLSIGELVDTNSHLQIERIVEMMDE